MSFEQLTSYLRHVHQISSYPRSIERLARRRVFRSSVVQVRNLISDGLLRFVAVNYLRAVVEGDGGSRPSGCCERGREVQTKTRKGEAKEIGIR